MRAAWLGEQAIGRIWNAHSGRGPDAAGTGLVQIYYGVRGRHLHRETKRMPRDKHSKQESVYVYRKYWACILHLGC